MSPSSVENDHLYFWQGWKVWWSKETLEKLKTFTKILLYTKYMLHIIILESWVTKPQILVQSGERVWQMYIIQVIFCSEYIISCEIIVCQGVW